VDLNLNTLKREILDYLEASGFAIFHSSPGGLEGTAMVVWDAEHYPDYQMFLDVATKSGNKLVLFAAREFESGDIDELVSQLEECELSRDERREYERRLRDLRAYEGVTCSLELAFDHQSRLYVYQVQPDWFDEFLELEDELYSHMAEDGDELDDGDSLGGYFSKN
jgi:hypothetical protein